MALVMVIAAIGSIGTCTVTSALNEEQIDTTLETVVSRNVSTETSVVTSTTTPMTTTTTSTTATIESTYVVEIEVDEGLYETKVVHSGEMINWSGVTTRPFTTSTTATTITTTTTTTTTTETTTEIPVVEVNNSINISDADYILLCNCVAHEAGATYISASEKAKVVEVIMNRVNSGSFPDSIYGVITQRSQFAGASGYANLGCYSNQVDDLVKEGVDLYLSDPSSYQHGYLYFHGDGKQNYFK